MRSLRFSFLATFCSLASVMLLANAGHAQPVNDNWAQARALSGVWASATNDNSGATAEVGEPSHAGQPATNSIWYKWTAPTDGEVTLDTLGSGFGLPFFDTVLAVYDGTNVATLRQVAANDDLYPFVHNIESGQVVENLFPVPTGLTFLYTLPFSGPSTLRFNATAGNTYYIAADTKFGNTGPIVVNLAYHPTGVFRFATEDFDFLTGAPLFQCSEFDSIADNDSVDFSYYQFHPPGVLVTVTRVAGSSGRMLVDYATQDGSAVGGTDYLPVSGTLVFDDFEMSKTIVIPITFQISLFQRDFSVVLSNARLDPAESPGDLPPPRVDNIFAVADVRILPVGAPADDPDQYPDPMSGAPPTHDVFNFGQSHYYIPEDINSYYTRVEIRVYRTLAQSQNGDGATLHYRINNILESRANAAEEDNNLFPLTAGSEYAVPDPPNVVGNLSAVNPDFEIEGVNGNDYNFPGGGTLTFGAIEGFRSIFLMVTNDNFVEFKKEFKLQIYRDIKGGGIGLPGEVAEATVTVLFDDRDAPAGSVDEFHNADFGVDMAPPVATTPPQIPHPGADGVVYSLVSQPDGKTIIGGNFFSYNTIGRRCIARMNDDGGLDSTFNPAGGADDFISSVLLTANGQIIVGGGFDSFNAVSRKKVARLNPDGSLDFTFNPGQGADAPIWATAVQADGKIIVAGEFTSFDVTNRLHVARLNSDGSLDTSFNPGTNGPNGTVWAVAVQADGRIVIAGEFTALGGTSRNGIARLNPNGSIDATFNPGTGADGIIYTIALRADGKLWVGGEFGVIDGNRLKRFARINANGSVDTTFDPGTGADATVYSIAIQPDGVAYVGGIFTSFNGTHRLGFTRLFQDGTIDTSFLDTAYNQFAGLHRGRFSDPSGIVFTSSVQPDGNVLIGGSFLQVGGGQADANIRFDPSYPTNTFNVSVWSEKKARNGLRNRSNVARLIGGSTPGPGNIGLLFDSYPVSENQSALTVSLTRQNGTLGYLSANFSVQSGLAQSGIDYIYNSVPPIYLSSWRAYLLNFLASVPGAETRMHSDGLFGTNSVPTDIFNHFWFNYTPGQCTVSIVNDNIVQGDRGASLQLANPSGADQFYLGSENIPLGGALGRSKAAFNIADDDHHSGSIGFSVTNYVVGEGGGTATINVTRTNGSFGTVSIGFSTANGTAVAGIDYDPTNGSLTFGNGQTLKSFTVRIRNNSQVQPIDRTVLLRLSSPGGGPQLGVTNAILNIVDDDYPPGFINFSSASYATNESSGAVTLTLLRSGGSRGVVSVDCITTNGSAVAGVDYIAVTNTIQWNDFDVTPRYVTVPLIHDNLPGSNKTFQAYLTNPRVNTTNAPVLIAGATTRTTVTILEDDSYGTLQFASSSYLVNENGGYATVTVTRQGGIAGRLTVNFFTADAGAVSSGPLPNYVATNGILTFDPGEVSKSFNIAILDDGVLDPALDSFFFTVNLSGLTPADAVLGTPTTVPIYILDAEGYNRPAGSLDTAFEPAPGMNGDIFALSLQFDGRILAGGNFSQVNNFARNRLARLNSDSSLDFSFLTGGASAGANGAVRSMLLQSSGRALIGGAFTTINGVNRNHFARLVGDGSLDTSFNPGAGADDSVFALAETFLGQDRKILVGGGFSTIGGATSPGLARLNDDGSVDGSFNPLLNLNGSVLAIAIYPTNSIQGGKIVIAGDFTSVNGITRPRIARLNSDGTIDNTFNPGTGASDSVRALALQLDGRVLLGGAFTNVNGLLLNRYARLNVNGSVDTSFHVGAGADDTVLAIAVQPDNRILLAGQFTSASGVSRGRITRLLPDGSVDPAINFGAGANAFINSLILQPDGMILLGGGFTQYDNQPRQRIARIYGGSLAGSGAFEFAAPNFQVDENGTNAIISVRRRGGTAGQATVGFATSDGTAVAGINYSNVSGSLTFPVGETLRTFSVPVRDDLQITPDLTVNLLLNNAPLANQPTAILTVINDDSSISFASPAYSRAENASDGFATIGIVRSGSTRGAASVDFLTTTNGTALLNTNYVGVTNTITFQPGDTNLSVKVPVLHDPRAQGDTTVVMVLANANNAILAAPSTSVLTIIDVERAPGQFMFTQVTNFVSESAGFIPISILRTNGRAGVVSVNFATIPGTALPGVKYLSTNGILTFNDNEVLKTFTVPILEEGQVEGAQTFSVILTNANGGSSITGPTNATVTILDDDLGVTFSSPVYIVSENSASVNLTVLRQNGTNGITTVNYTTTNNTAVAGTNYLAASGTLVFTNGETAKGLSIGILHDPRVTGDLNFNVVLSSPTPPAQLLTPSTATVTVLDNEPGFAFTNAAFATAKSATNLLITVIRSNANTGIVSVNYATSNGTAIAGIDYVATNNILVFSNGIASQSFLIPIINNRLVQGDRQFTVNLLNPSAPGQLVFPSTATITITDDLSGMSFSAPAYSISENGGAATITVLRSGYTNSTVAVNYFTTNGTAVPGFNYTNVAGTLVFTNGETVKTFSVPVKDNGVLEGDKTVQLRLTNVVGNIVLVNPPSATLTILEVDGSQILPAGSALVSESGPVNGVIDPGELITVQLALRDASGTNTANLTATLLATNGVSPVGSPTQNYGVLAAHGPGVSRPFSFTANATNSQNISVTLHLQDGSHDLGEAEYNFTVGSSVTSFTNLDNIIIRDNTSALPYPSIISVSGIGGVVSKATVTFTNLSHTAPSDIDALLVSPVGQKALLMAKCGGRNSVNHILLNFDDSAANSLPQSTAIVSGTYKPTSYAAAPPPFPVPAPPSPYGGSLTAIAGGNPNGNWSLFIMDDTALDSGSLSNGWVLRLTSVTPVPATADLALGMTGSPGVVVATSNLTYTLSLTNFGPASASNVVVSDFLPAGVSYVSASGSQGVIATNGLGLVTWSISSLAQNATASLSLVVRPSLSGLLINAATVVAGSFDPNQDDDTSTVTTVVVSPSADLVLGLNGTPNPANLGANITYTLSITNLGPATATSVGLTNTLPPGVSLLTASPAGYQVSGSVVSWPNLGNIPSGTVATATIVVRTLVSGTLTDGATCGATIIDPLKGNNSASIKTDVGGPALKAVAGPNTITLTWPSDAANYVLESANNLQTPITWSQVSEPPQVNGGIKSITFGTTNTSRFFRLRAPTP